MSSSRKADDLVMSRSDNLGKYRRNFLTQVVAEFRFPVMMELGEVRTPTGYVKTLRKEYPSHAMEEEVTMGVGKSLAANGHSHLLRSSDSHWTVALRPAAVSVNTDRYPGYAKLKERVMRVLDAAYPVIDTDFFTRVGLRYINSIKAGFDDSKNNPLDRWVNGSLVAPLLTHKFKGISSYSGRMQLGAVDGGCLLQHALKIRDDEEDSLRAEYVIDIDSSRSDVAFSDVSNVLDAMHTQIFDLFDWTLGPDSKEHLTSLKGLY